MENKFISIVNENIKRSGVDNLIQWLGTSDFFIAPASTKFHGNYEKGLLEHSINVYKCLCDVLQSNNITEYDAESIAIVSLFHDICKANFYKKGFRNVKNESTGQWEKKQIYEINDSFPVGHGEKSVIMLQQFITLTRDEIYAIRWHMGGFDNAVKGGDYGISAAYNNSKLAVALHIADLAATYFLENAENKS